MIRSEMEILRPNTRPHALLDHHDFPPIKWEDDFSLFMIVETTTHHADSSSNSGRLVQVRMSDM